MVKVARLLNVKPSHILLQQRNGAGRVCPQVMNRFDVATQESLHHIAFALDVSPSCAEGTGRRKNLKFPALVRSLAPALSAVNAANPPTTPVSILPAAKAAATCG